MQNSGTTKVTQVYFLQLHYIDNKC